MSFQNVIGIGIALWLLGVSPQGPMQAHAQLHPEDLLSWPIEGQITDTSLLTAMVSSPLVDSRYCPQLLQLDRDASGHDADEVLSPGPRPLVLFCIPKGSRGRPWNQLEPAEGEIGPVELTAGQLLRILNFDEDTADSPGHHRVHTNGGLPCPHQPGELYPLVRNDNGDIQQVSYYDCPITVDIMEPLDAQGFARLYDHYDGKKKSPFYIRVSAEFESE